CSCQMCVESGPGPREDHGAAAQHRMAGADRPDMRAVENSEATAGTDRYCVQIAPLGAGIAHGNNSDSLMLRVIGSDQESRVIAVHFASMTNIDFANTLCAEGD